MLKVGKRDLAWLGGIPSNDENDPRPFLLPGVRVQFAPIGRAAFRAARRLAAKAYEANPEEIEEAGDAITEELLRRGVKAWEGVGLEDGPDDEDMDLTPENLELTIADPRFFEAADYVYVMPFIARQREGNVSAPSPSGTGAGETPADGIATSLADIPLPTGASPKKAKRAVRTSSTSRGRTKAARSGNS
jgi:hypothetical protein